MTLLVRALLLFCFFDCVVQWSHVAALSSHIEYEQFFFLNVVLKYNVFLGVLSLVLCSLRSPYIAFLKLHSKQPDVRQVRPLLSMSETIVDLSVSDQALAHCYRQYIWNTRGYELFFFLNLIKCNM